MDSKERLEVSATSRMGEPLITTSSTILPYMKLKGNSKLFPAPLVAVLLLFSLLVTGLKATDNKSTQGNFDIESFALPPVTQQEEGMPERGRFLFIYSYEGEEIEPEISITRNGAAIVSLSRLSPVSSDTLADMNTEKGDLVNFNTSFGNTQITVYLDSSFGTFPQGFWANAFSVNFFEVDEEGNVVRQLGRMSIMFYLFPPFDGFVMTAAPSSISPGEDAVLSLQAVEMPDIPVIIPENTAVDLLMSENGKRLGGYALPDFGIHGGLKGIINVPYGFITNTTLLYRASPDSSLLEGSSETVSLVAFSRFDVTINGGTAVEVRVDEEDDLTLQLEIIGETTIWPTIPQFGVHPVFRSNLSELVRDSTELRVLVKSGEEPIENSEVTVLAIWKEGSGGHNHNGASALKSLPEELMGRFTNLSNSETANGKITAVTDSTGIILLRYNASEFGGKINFKAQVTLGEETIETMKQLTKEVPNLEPLREGDHYKKVGGVPNHHGPRVDGQFPNSRTPDNNHYGTRAFVDSLISVANTWHELVTNDETMDDRQTPLNINDMSLPNGGLFDIGGRWSPSHDYHRIGRDADIRTTRSFPITPSVRNGVLLRRIVINEVEHFLNSRFEELSIAKGANPKPQVHGSGANEHYHLYFY